MSFDFDTPIDRRVVPALKMHPMVLGKDGTHLFPAGVADMDFAVAPAIIEALEVRARHPVFGYEAVPDALMPALTGWLKTRNGWEVPAEHILRAPNALNSLAIAVSLFSDPGDAVIVQPPVFFDFYDIVKENHRALLSNPLTLHDGRYEMDFDGLEEIAAKPQARILLLCNPHNPVGRVWTAEELTRLTEICARNGVLVVADELHGDLTYPGHPWTPAATVAPRADTVISVISPAKTFNIASVCASFTVVLDDSLRAAFEAENSRLTVNKNNAFSSAAMVAAYSEGGPWLEAVLEYLAGNLALLRDRLDPLQGVTLIEPEGTFLAWLDFNGLGLDAPDLTAFLREKAGWAITRGVAFGPEGAGFARLNYACPRAQLDRALDALAQAITQN